MITVALAGNPNCGKTTLFNSLTGSTAHVGNWPGVTVDKKEGIYKKTKENIKIIDLPGIYSLSPYTPEEVISRNYILDTKPSCIINVVDATNLERNLYLTTQLLEIDVPVVIALNMMDIVAKTGDVIDKEALEKELGVPVVLISASKETNLDVLMSKVYNECHKTRKGSTFLEKGNLSHLIQDCKTAFIGLDVENPLFHAIKLVENDELEVKDHPDLVKIVTEFKKTFNDDVFGNDLEAIVADQRYNYISKHYSSAKKKNTENSEHKLTKSDKADRVLTNKWAAIPIFLVILFLVFHLTFSENLFFLGKAIKFSGNSFEGKFFDGLLYTENGINSPGVILSNFLASITDHISEGVSSLMSNSSSWAKGLVVDGILGGVFAVLSFIPQILLLFLFFSILEDSGYMARVAFILDRIFRKFGLSGRAFMPMIMGFGCSVPAMINTRTLADDNERTSTIRVIPFFSCGAKLPILTAIAGGICFVFDFKYADLITYSMYLVGMITAIVAIILMRHTVMRGEVAPFIMELPTYHAPKFKALMFHLWDKLKHYVKKAFTIILASTIVIWFLQSFTWNWKYIEQVDIVELCDEKYDEELDNVKELIIAYDNEYKDDKAYGEKPFVKNGEVVADLKAIMVYYSSLNDSLDNSNNEEKEKTNAKIEKLNVIITPVFEKALADYKEQTGSKDYLDTSDSILAGLGKLIQPVFTPLGFGSQLNDNGWVYGVSAITGLIAKENVIATFTVLSQCTTDNENIDKASIKDLYMINLDEEGVSASIQMINNSGLNAKRGWAILIAFIVFNMTTIPCFAAVATAKAELPNNKFKGTILFWLATSYIASMICYLVLRYVWPLAIIAVVSALLILGLHYYNKNHTKNIN